MQRVSMQEITNGPDTCAFLEYIFVNATDRYYILRACLSSEGRRWHGGLHNVPEFLESAAELEREISIGVLPIGVELTYLATCN